MYVSNVCLSTITNQPVCINFNVVLLIVLFVAYCVSYVFNVYILGTDQSILRNGDVKLWKGHSA